MQVLLRVARCIGRSSAGGRARAATSVCGLLGSGNYWGLSRCQKVCILRFVCDELQLTERMQLEMMQVSRGLQLPSLWRKLLQL